MLVASSTPEHDEQDAGDPLEVRARCGAAVRRAAATTRCRARHEERHADAQRVRAQQDRAAPDLLRSRRDRERGREQRTDARAPARAERDADDVGPRDAR